MGVPITDENHVTTVTASMSPYSVSLWDRLIILDCTDGPIAVLLPPVVVSSPKRYDFKKIDSTANAATITPNGADTIDGAATRVLSFQWQTFGSTATAVGWTVNYSPMILAADGESSSVKAPAANDARLSNARVPLSHSHAPADVTGTAVVTADARLSDARTPLAHAHAAADVTGTAVLTADARLSDSRTPLAHDAAGSAHNFPGGTSNFLRSDGTFAAPTASIASTTVEVDLGSLATWRGTFTITDAAITAAKKVLCWQAPGPYTGKGTRADESELQPVQVISVEPLSGSAKVRWQTPPMLTMARAPGGALSAALVNATPTRLGKVRGNLKFSYVVMA